MNCRWNGLNEPRVLPDRHEPDCLDESCRGCQPCVEPHCAVCSKAHATAVCPECVASTRDDLDTIATLCDALPAETVHRGVNSEAAMLWGPTADPEAWRNRAMSAMMGRLDAAYLEDCRDELHPLYVLGTWEQIWRDHLDQPTDLRVTLPRLVAYLTRQMHVMADEIEPPFDEFARELRQCRAHVEDVLHAGERDEKGAPCVQCERPMVRVVTDQGAQDSYYCSRCRRTVSGDQYRYAVGVAYRAHADRLTAADMAERFSESDLKASTVRVWGSRDLIRKRGRNDQGIMLYDVSDVVTRMAEVDAEETKSVV